MKLKHFIKIVFITGLPGAGKTTYADTLASSNDRVIHLDELNPKDLSDPNKFCLEQAQFPYRGGKYSVIIEGLIGISTLDTLLKEIYGRLEKLPDFSAAKTIPVEIIKFQDDIKACLWNDRARNRELKASATIKNLNLDFSDLEIVMKKYPKLKAKLTEKKVEKASPVEVWLKENGIEYQTEDTHQFSYRKNYPQGYFLFSPAWCLGGTSGDCYSSELKDYGGSTTYAYWKTDLAKLYDLLVADGIIEEVK